MDMDMDSLFAPLPKEYCLWFYGLSILGFIMLVLFLGSSLILGISKKKGSEYYLGILATALTFGLYYFQNRLLYSMCVSH